MLDWVERPGFLVSRVQYKTAGVVRFAKLHHTLSFAETGPAVHGFAQLVCGMHLACAMATARTQI